MAEFCHSCTAPLSAPNFKGPSEIYCKYCTDDKGNLKPREWVREGISQWFLSWQPGITKEIALKRADVFMQAMPAWAEM